jgi:probable addiction module antidote protein
MKKTTSFQEHLIEMLRKDDALREAYLNEALNESEGRVSLRMFRNVAEALGGITKLAKSSGLNRQNLYKALSGKKDPAFSTVEGIVHGFGFRIKVEPIGKRKKGQLLARA